MDASDTLPGEPDAVTRPTVAVVCRPAMDRYALSVFIGDRPKLYDIPCSHAGLVEACGRLCYDAWEKGRPHAEYIARLIAEQHTSVLEHVQWTLFVRGVSRALLAELTRHRHASFSVRSQRYCDESGCRFVIPPDLLDAAAEWEEHNRPFRETEADWPAVSDALDVALASGDHIHMEPCPPTPPTAREFCRWLETCHDARETYRVWLAELIARKVPRKAAHGLARSLLPGCTETTLALTGNARTFRELLGKRLGAGAEPEIIRFSKVLRDVLAAECPLLFAGLAG